MSPLCPYDFIFISAHIVTRTYPFSNVCVSVVVGENQEKQEEMLKVFKHLLFEQKDAKRDYPKKRAKRNKFVKFILHQTKNLSIRATPPSDDSDDDDEDASSSDSSDGSESPSNSEWSSKSSPHSPTPHITVSDSSDNDKDDGGGDADDFCRDSSAEERSAVAKATSKSIARGKTTLIVCLVVCPTCLPRLSFLSLSSAQSSVMHNTSSVSSTLVVCLTRLPNSSA